MKKLKKTSKRTLKLNRETLQALNTTTLENVVGGAALGTAFPCWTENNCPAPA